MTKRLQTLALVLFALGIAMPAASQPPAAPDEAPEAPNDAPAQADEDVPARGPADVLSGTRGRPAVPAPTGRPRSLEVARDRASAAVPVGVIEILVSTPEGAPVEGAPIRVGVMQQDGGRESLTGETDAEGRLLMSDLPTGSGQAYRVNLSYEGATYASNPFRLEPDRGHQVFLRQAPVTRDTSRLLQRIGQTMLEYRNERIHVTQQAQIDNLGQETVVFGEDGLHIDLPRGFTAFQTQQTMTDQRLIADDTGFALKGSLPPGRIALTWAFDLPMDADADVHVRFPVPFRTWRYRVITQAAEGMELEVEGFPPSEVREGAGHRYLHTQLERTPESPELERVDILVSGIPGPGPIRFAALGGAIILLLLGLLLVTRGGDRKGALERARREREEELLEEAVALEAALKAEEIGPKFRARRMEEIVGELASLLHLDAGFRHATGADRSKAPAKKKQN